VNRWAYAQATAATCLRRSVAFLIKTTTVEQPPGTFDSGNYHENNAYSGPGTVDKWAQVAEVGSTSDATVTSGVIGVKPHSKPSWVSCPPNDFTDRYYYNLGYITTDSIAIVKWDLEYA
jgi:hypothetical protein